MNRSTIQLSNKYNQLLLNEIGIVAEDILLIIIEEVLYECSEECSVSLPVAKLKAKANRRKYNNTFIVEKLSEIRGNLRIINIDTLESKPIHLFDFYCYDNVLQIKINPKYINYITQNSEEIREYYTIKMYQYMTLKNSGARLVYRLCAQWRFRGRTGKYRIEFLKSLLGISENSKTISALKKGVDVLVNLFGLHIEMKTYNAVTYLRGRPAVESIEFIFPRAFKNTNCFKLKKAWNCPYCGEQLYEKQNKTTGEVFYAHITKNGKCKATFSTIAQIKGYCETPERNDNFDDNENDVVASLNDQINNAFN